MNPQEPTPLYVALGDSISIDEYAGGAGRGAASLLARNRDDDFPSWRGYDLGGMPWHLLATDGGTTTTLLADQLPRLEHLGKNPSIVSLTIGGNDVLSCYGDTRAALEMIATVTSRLRHVLDRLRAVAQPGARVVVGTVYDPSDGTGDTASVGLPAWPDVTEVLAQLNAGLSAVALESGGAVADIHGHFLGHGLSRGNPAQRDPRPADRDLWFCQIIEPNAWGANGVRAAFWEALGGEMPVSTPRSR
ncbi:MAG: SGNH/GDSL hydrolase family protein [Nocardioidaceae bacterium]|nr:SGNH/GDSL hydrolase family protein [Nocardioidaceae bacterium]